jgi:hypothetical protein
MLHFKPNMFFERDPVYSPSKTNLRRCSSRRAAHSNLAASDFVSHLSRGSDLGGNKIRGARFPRALRNAARNSSRSRRAVALLELDAAYSRQVLALMSETRFAPHQLARRVMEYADWRAVAVWMRCSWR